MKLFLLALAGIVALTAGSMLLIYRLTEDPPTTASSRAAQARAAQASAEAPPRVQNLSEILPAEDPSQLPAVELAPTANVIPGGDPRYPGPVPNEVAPIEGPPPAGLPTNPEERDAALDEVRKKRFGDQMDRINRRNEQRGGRPAAATTQVLPPGPGRPASSRRGALQPTE
jgi:hypothetical protein